jgi:excisionase family DNA binding protein
MGSDFYTPSEAARILSRSGKTISERRVRQMLQAGEIAGERPPNGRWRIPQDAVHELLDERREDWKRSESGNRNDSMTAASQTSSQTAPDAALSGPESVRELLSRVESLSRELGRSEARLELTELAESSVREERDRLLGELEQEREERRRLSGQLHQLREPSKETDGEDEGGAASEAPDSQEYVSEGYGRGSSFGEPERGLQSPLRRIRGIAARLLGRG